jgi:hypothetical protein
VRRAAFVVFFWVVAAGLVFAAPSHALKVAVIVAVSFLYMRLTARDATLDHALFAGAAWLALAIAAEIITAGKADLLVRNALMFTWIAAPALFATRS